MAKDDSTLVPANARMQAYELLALKSPARVVIDTDLPVGTWLIVRSATPREREQLTGQPAKKADK